MHVFFKTYESYHPNFQISKLAYLPIHLSKQNLFTLNLNN